ncbi:hypothetical protein B2H97_13310 [Paraclostridium bifermentans]|uniref:hypothetical protein n=1 Tax=Paraclostridium bifermentans TaxID=1490 RepID=UPI000A176E26|nr:hypothetical protein [Paraclostridium bifermentans]OSB08931.1 hypothetical protein B2H97_13310 [Paraclostridium bifermentans]
MNDTSKRIIIRTAWISILSIIIINGINYISIKSLPIAHNSDWIPFYGSFIGAILSGIVGGLITLEGVKETINDAKEARKIDERQRIRPYLHMELVGLDGSSTDIEIDVKNTGENRGNSKYRIFSIKLNNIGLESCVNIRMDNKIIENSLQKGCLTKEFTIKSEFYDGEESINNIAIEVTFEDLMGNLYKQEYCINFLGNVEKYKLRRIQNNTSPVYIETRK